MSDERSRIELEFGARDDNTAALIKQLNDQIEALGKNADVSTDLSKNLEPLKEITKQASQARSEIERMRQSMADMAKEAVSSDNRVDRVRATSATMQMQQQVNRQQAAYDAMSPAMSTVPQSAYLSNGYRYTTDKVGDSAKMMESRFDATQAVRRENKDYGILNRDLTTTNRSLLNQTGKVQATNDSNSRLSYRQYSRVQQTLEKAHGDLYDDEGNSKYQQSFERLGNLRKQRSEAFEGKAELSQKMARGEKLSAVEEQRMGVYQEEIKVIQARINGEEQIVTRLKNIQDNAAKLEQAVGDVRGISPQNGTFKKGIYDGIGKATNVGLFGVAAAAGGYAMKGNSIIEQDQPYTRALSANAGTYDSRSEEVAAQNKGRAYGIKGSEMLRAEGAFTSGAGYTSQEDVTEAGLDTGKFAKRTGQTLEESTSLTEAYVQGNAGASSKGLKDLQNTFAGAIKQSGLDKYGKQQADSLVSLIQTTGKNSGGALSDNQQATIASIQATIAGTKDGGLRGQNGADKLAGFDSMIRGGGSNPLVQMALMQSDPSKYNGSSGGYANILRQTEKGISDPENLKAILGMGDSMPGSTKEDQSSFLANTLRQSGVNVNTDQVTELRDLSKSGKLTDSDISKLKKEGENSNKDKDAVQQNSSDASYDKGQAAFEKATTEIADLTRKISSMALQTVAANGALLIFTTALAGAAGSVAKSAVGSVITNKAKDMASIHPGSSSSSKGSTPTTRTGRRKANSLSGRIKAKGATALNALGATEDIADVLSPESDMQSKLSDGVSLASTGVDAAEGYSAIKGASRASEGVTKGLTRGGAKGLSKALPGVGAALTVADIGINTIPHLLSDDTNENKGKDIGGQAGGLAGAAGGAALGASIGSIVPGVGTVIGGAVGGIAGWFGGNSAGEAIGGAGGKLLDDPARNSTDQKNEETNTDKRIDVEKMRASNIKDDQDFVSKYQNALGSGTNSGNSDQPTLKSSSSGQGSYDSAQNGGKKGAAHDQVIGNPFASNSLVTIKVSGDVKHSGEVTDTSQLRESVADSNGVLNILNNLSSGNETARY